ncbi:DUF4825 domain-containing protein [Listeria booriae]|uniref:DUF4825 domain-containing protein n=1 Tax=Listeria booriae TaxID=1552123 RepID=A0A7X1DRT1_9LIST|nr:DUF4825 domain-containing protein [Listeria booriae]MBC2371893.1 DUF4825 domain-containing protein [Listeria booriae]
MLEKNAAVLFALIPNVDKVTFQFDESGNDSSLAQHMNDLISKK